MKKILILIVVVLLGAGAFMALSKDKTNTDNSSSQLAPIYAYQWQLEDIETASVTDNPENMSDFVITFNADNLFNVETDCNNLFGGYTIENGTSLSFGPVASTRMICEGRMFEREFSTLLGNVDSYSISNNEETPRLIMSLAEGTMTFVAQADNIPAIDEEQSVPAINLDDFLGMTEEEAVAYAAENDVLFRVGSRDGVALPVTMDYRIGRVTADINAGVVTGFTVEQ